MRTNEGEIEEARGKEERDKKFRNNVKVRAEDRPPSLHQRPPGALSRLGTKNQGGGEAVRPIRQQAVKNQPTPITKTRKQPNTRASSCPETTRFDSPLRYRVKTLWLREDLSFMSVRPTDR